MATVSSQNRSLGRQAGAESEKSALILGIVQAHQVLHEGEGRRTAELLGGQSVGGLIAAHAGHDNERGQKQPGLFGDCAHASPLSAGGNRRRARTGPALAAGTDLIDDFLGIGMTLFGRLA